jgi:hypothetical protein
MSGVHNATKFYFIFILNLPQFSNIFYVANFSDSRLYNEIVTFFAIRFDKPFLMIFKLPKFK